MPTCQKCKQKWSWWQTMKNIFSFRAALTCPVCHETQYLSTQYRKQTTIISVLLGPVIIFGGIYFGLSFASLFIGIAAITVSLIIQPFIMELSNKEEPLF